ncbi:peroxisomal d3,d2-enoyl-CoA isomerase [Mytilinidion resinicola]|uniref:Peroxisomal d3,d2-enoyl-CoA isomerase n=1 Tax=Mytilinidion resinicola TaxID=574789 RepID=A0A6A6Z8F4_9PEZI|nr:peroxisomal d3,d2-enoyl-CoA isomerase [Mytilinidion resinicola]KAF2817088.1 peroxisomal d3,d2-enoyl-CoA isomerase [Mytilinidion resinicola]
MAAKTYDDIKLEITGKIGVIKFNRPKSLNAFGGSLIADTIDALRYLDEHPDTIFTVLTGEGRFFSAGADVKATGSEAPVDYKYIGEKKLAMITRFGSAIEILRSMIDHHKVLILALNGPAVGAGACWFPGVADIVLASRTTYLQCPFSALALVPENGSALSFAQHIGIHRANDFLMFGRKLSVEECEAAGLVNYVFEEAGDAFQAKVLAFLQGQLDVNDGKSMMEMKRLQNAPIRDARMVAVYNAMDALAERFVEDAPVKRFAEKKKELLAKKRSSKI